MPAPPAALPVRDSTAPPSGVGSVPSTASGTSISAPFTASDNTNGSGLATTEVWARFRANDSVASGTWALAGSAAGATGSVTVSFGSGPGIYDLSTIAVDLAGNQVVAADNAGAAALVHHCKTHGTEQQRLQ